MPISDHARIRGRQRGISAAEMILLASFGRREHRPGNTFACYLDREGYRLLEEVLKNGVQLLDKLRTQTIICDDNDTIITCYHHNS